MPSSRAGSRSPRFRLALLDLFLTVALPLATQVATITGKGRPEVEQARETEGPITPVTGAFTIWGPIFACLLAYGVQRVRSYDELENPPAEALIRASLVGTILWSLNAQFKDFGWQSLALIGASAATATGSVARFACPDESDDLSRRVSYLLAPLAGWLSIATFANLDATQRFTESPGQKVVTPPVILALATVSTVGGVVATKGNLAYTAASAWGVGGIILKHARREPALAATASAGLAVVAATTLIVRRQKEYSNSLLT